jgi:hypothetical protein
LFRMRIGTAAPITMSSSSLLQPFIRTIIADELLWGLCSSTRAKPSPAMLTPAG